MRHGEFEDPRLIAVYDAENVWGWDDDFFMAVLAERFAPHVLDFGCGTGRLAIAMAAAGHEVIGIDPARAALEAARGKPGADRVRWIEGSVEMVPERSVDAVLMTSHVAQYFITDAEWLRLLRALRRALRPGGRLIFDSRDPDDRRWERWNPVDSRRTIVLPGGDRVVGWTDVTSADDGVVAFVNHYEFPGGAELTSSATLRFRSEAELRSTVERSGFDVDRVYGGWAREPVGLSGDGELVVIAVVRPKNRA